MEELSKLTKEELSQFLYPLLTKILKACDVGIVDESLRREILEAAFESIDKAMNVAPETTITFLVNILKERSHETIAGKALEILAAKAGMKLPPEERLEDWLAELGLEHLKEKALQSMKKEQS